MASEGRIGPLGHVHSFIHLQSVLYFGQGCGAYPTNTGREVGIRSQAKSANLLVAASSYRDLKSQSN